MTEKLIINTYSALPGSDMETACFSIQTKTGLFALNETADYFKDDRKSLDRFNPFQDGCHG